MILRGVLFIPMTYVSLLKTPTYCMCVTTPEYYLICMPEKLAILSYIDAIYGRKTATLFMRIGATVELKDGVSGLKLKFFNKN